MMTVSATQRVVLGGAAIFAATASYAADSGFYGDFDVGRATYSYATDVNLPVVTLSAADSRIKDTSWGATVGYRFTPHLGTELSYVSLGKASVPAADAAGAGLAHGTFNFSSRGPAVALVGAVQLGYLEMFLKLGYLFARADLSVAGTDGATKLNAKVTASTPAPLGGLGLRYAFNDRWHVKLEFDRYDAVGNALSTGAANINVATLGIGFLF
jgi:hypothetical protein